MNIAIVKPIKVRRSDLGALTYILGYAADPDKTNGGELVSGWNCDKGRDFKDMLRTKHLFGKTTGRQYAHFVQSFHEKDDLTPELAFKIGQEFIARNEKWRDFQILMAVHTDEEHLHIHYVINSVNMKDGTKWQSSQYDLKQMRVQSDELCRRYNLHVIERGNCGHQSYGEYAANQKDGSWKQRLAADIAGCLQYAKSRVDFLHRLDECGIDADFGEKNVMFFIGAGTYGLKKDMKCGDYALRSYGDFSKQNIYNHFKLNKGLLELALDDVPLLQDALLEIGRMMFPNNPTELQDRYFATEFADFDRMTRDEIEAYLKRKKLEQIRKKALAERDKQSGGGGLILATITETLQMIIEERNKRKKYYELVLEREYENEL